MPFLEINDPRTYFEAPQGYIHREDGGRRSAMKREAAVGDYKTITIILKRLAARDKSGRFLVILPLTAR